MVSGLVTSPCDQLRIFSGDATLMRIASKSAIGFAMSKGLERYNLLLRFLRCFRYRRRLPIKHQAQMARPAGLFQSAGRKQSQRTLSFLSKTLLLGRPSSFRRAD